MQTLRNTFANLLGNESLMIDITFKYFFFFSEELMNDGIIIAKMESVNK